MNQVVGISKRFITSRMRAEATTPNSPREIGVGVVMPREMNPDRASKSKVRQTRWRGMALSRRAAARRGPQKRVQRRAMFGYSADVSSCGASHGETGYRVS